MKGLQQGSSDIPNRYGVPTHISLTIIQSTSHQSLIPKRRKKRRKEVIPQDCQKALRWEQGCKSTKGTWNTKEKE